MNLIQADWLPVRRLSGARETIAPHRITEGFSDDPVMALDFGRADFDGAIAEFLIGLLAVACPPAATTDDEAEEVWADAWETPPSPAALQKAFAPLAFAFNMGGDGPRCFQDIDPLKDCKPLDLRLLLIDAPGENAEKLNNDLFQKLDSTPDFALSFTAAAVITRQTYDPGSGSGYRTSMRGGGPLTTLAVTSRTAPVSSRGDDRITTLWDRLWPNVPDRTSNAPTLDKKLFPWLDKTQTSEKNQVCTQQEMHDLHCFFGMPCRIRLVYDADGAPSGYRRRKHGINYEAWMHPLSPYYTTKDNTLPVHPQSRPVSYEDWLGVLAGHGEGGTPAAMLNIMTERVRFLEPEDRERVRVEAFGYAMKKAKVLSWTTQTIPFFVVPDARRNAFVSNLRMVVASAEAMAQTVKYAIRIAFFGERDANGRVKVRDAGGETGMDAVYNFWAQSEPAFRAFADNIAGENATTENDQKQRRVFFDKATSIAHRVFDAHVDMDAVLADKPWRYSASLRALNIGLSTRNGKKNSAHSLLGFAPETQTGEREVADVH